MPKRNIARVLLPILLALAGCAAPVVDESELVSSELEDTSFSPVEPIYVGDGCRDQTVLFDGACRAGSFFERFVSSDAELLAVSGYREDDLGAVVTEQMPWGAMRILRVEPTAVPVSGARRTDRVYRADYPIASVDEIRAIDGEHPHDPGVPYPWLLTMHQGRVLDLTTSRPVAGWGVTGWTLSTDNPNTSAPCELHSDGTYECVRADASGGSSTCSNVRYATSQAARRACRDLVNGLLAFPPTAVTPTGLAANLTILVHDKFSGGFQPDLVRTMCNHVGVGLGDIALDTCNLVALDVPTFSTQCAGSTGSCECPEGTSRVHGTMDVCQSGSWVTSEIGTTTDPDTGDTIESITITETDGTVCTEITMPADGLCASIG